MNAPRAVDLAVGFARVTLASRWADRVWWPVAIAPAGVVPAGAEAICGREELRLHADEAENYLLNLTAPTPVVFVIWRLEADVPSVLMVTASYGEAARMLDAGERVEGLPLPDDLRGWIEDFARGHYRPPERKPRARRYASTREAQGAHGNAAGLPGEAGAWGRA